MRVLISRTDVLGDAVVTSAFIHSLSQVLPNLELDILCHHHNLPAFRYHPLVKQIYTLNHHQGTKKLADNWFDVTQNINANLSGYDFILQLNGCIRSYFYISKIKARQVIVRKLITKSFRSKMLMLKYKCVDKFEFFEENVNQHEVTRLHQFLDYVLNEINIDGQYQIPDIARFYPGAQYVRDWISGSVLFNASGKKEVARYMNDSLLYSLIAHCKNLQVSKMGVIITTEDKERIMRIINDLDMNNQIDIIMDTDLYSLAKTIGEYETFIGVDGGLTHIAAGLGLKCITLFDKQDSQIWHPWSPTQISLQSQNKNIYDISYQEVINSLLELRDAR